jgi:hypothetical protein
MIAVIFEFRRPRAAPPNTSSWPLRCAPELQAVDGFLSIERFQSVTDPASSFRCHSGTMKIRYAGGATWKGIDWRCPRARRVLTDYRLRIAFGDAGTTG